MTSSIPVEGRFHQLRKPKFFVIFLSIVFALAGVRAYAASIPSVDTYTVSFQDDQLTFRTERTTYTIADADASNLVKIPLYFWYSSSAADNTYMSGWIIMAQTRFMNFTFNNGSVVPSYFESYDGGSYYCSSPASDYRFTVYFDNHIAANNTPHLLGYYVFDVSAYTAIQISVTSGTTNVNIASSGVYGSTGQYGLVQSVIDGLDNSEDIDNIIGALQDIDNVDLEAIISGISSNTSLLTQIYQRLGQMQSADQTFYNNIDNIIDNISWDSITINPTYYDANFNVVSSNTNVMYVDITDAITNNYGLLYFPSFVSTLGKIGHYSYYYNVESYILYIGNNTLLSSSSTVQIFTTNDNPSLFIQLFDNGFNNNYRFVIKVNSRSSDLLTKPINLQCKRLSIDDIEYWTICNYLRLYNLYDLIETYINADVSSPVDSAATQAAGLAQNQAAAEQSLAALSPGNMEDLDSALQGMDILDTVQQSTTFWGYLIQQFSTRSGPIWGIFIFGLILGLIGFILRLRE